MKTRFKYFGIGAISAGIFLVLLLQIQSLDGMPAAEGQGLKSEAQAHSKVSAHSHSRANDRIPASLATSEQELIKGYQKKTVDWLMDALQGNSPENSRDAVIEEAKKDPVRFAHAMEELLGELPLENYELRDSVMSVLGAVGASVVEGATEEKREAFFQVIHQVSKRELASNEFVNTDILNHLNEEQKDALAHEGKLIIKDGNYKISTFTNKVMAIQLMSLDQNSDRKQQFADLLKSDKIGQLDPFTRESLRLVAEQRLGGGASSD